MSEKRVAVVVGYHTYDVCALQEMFEGFGDLHCYVQHLEQFTSSPKDIRDCYDAVVFYTMEHRTPDENRPWYEGNVKEAMEHLGECGQGLVVLHHSLLAFENWPAHSRDFSRELAGFYFYQWILYLHLFANPSHLASPASFQYRPCSRGGISIYKGI